MILGVAVIAAGSAGLFWMLDLDYLSAHFRHQAAAKRTRNIYTGSNYLNAGKNAELWKFGKFHVSSIIICVSLRHIK